jgi:hypothetical protein
MADAERCGCCITGCRRTFKRPADWPEGSRTICGRHWRMAPKSWRRRYTLFRRVASKLTDPRRDRAGDLCDQTWERCRAFIEDVVAGRTDDPALVQFLERL